jgi:adenosine deaminase
MTSDTKTLTWEEIHAWPKAELHSHLDGAMRLQTMLDLAREQNCLDILPATDIDGLEKELLKIDDSTDLTEYLLWFQYTIPLMQTAGALERVAFEMAEDFALENVRYLEVRYGPVLHTSNGLSLDDVNSAVRQGLSRAETKYRIRVSLIVCGLRDRYESASLRQAEMAVENRHNGVVGFDLAGGEAGNPPKQHLSAFYFARNHLLNLTVHAGESWGPDSIRQALFYCGAHRIGHGITLVQDRELLDYFVDHQIPLEICPTSNVQTHVVDSYETHPIRELVEAGVPVTVNTDSRLFSRTSTTRELYLAHTLCGISAAKLREIALNGFRYAFIPWDERQEMLRSAIADFPMPPTADTPAW